MTERAQPTTRGKRLDIQGLRMVAVVAVVVNHLTGHPVGGFVGVDVFFVISGFLITSHLLRDLSRTRGARHYIGDFYRRRVRRLFPAAFLVTGLTVLFAWRIFAASRFEQTWHDGLWATIFSANWHFIGQGTNYFTAALPSSPLQHYWSLSVEEQFYLVWPIALFIVGWATIRLLRARNEHTIRVTVGAAAAAALCAASVWWAIGQSSLNPTSAYFSTFTRAWELGLGAVLACVIDRVRGNSLLLTTVSWLGLTLIAISLFVAHGGVGFPMPGAALPCLGSALVILAYRPGVRTRNALLTNRVSVFVGDISYSVYLVHFPVIILLSAWMVSSGPYFYAAAILLTAGLSVALFALVEQPILRSEWLLPKEARHNHRHHVLSRFRLGQLRLTTSTQTMALAALSAVVAGMVVIAAWPGAAVQSNRRLIALSEAVNHSQDRAQPHSNHRTLSPALARVQREIESSLKAATWPHLTPSIDAVTGAGLVPSWVSACGQFPLPAVSECTFGSTTASHTMVVVGDSNAMVYVPMLRMVLQSEPNWKLIDLAGSDCEFADRVILKSGTTQANTCNQRNNQVVGRILQLRPDALIVTNVVTPDSAVKPVTNELQAVKSAVGKVVLLGAPPFGPDPHTCYTRTSLPSDCVTSVPDNYFTFATNDRQIADAVGGVFIRTEEWTCAADYCPAFVGDTPSRYNAAHMSEPYAEQLTPVALAALRSAGVFGRWR